MYRIITILLVIIIISLTTTPAMAGKYLIRHEGPAPEAQPEEGKALVYWVRPSNLGTLVKTWAFVDDQFIGGSKGRGYFFANIPEGKHLFWSKAENRSQIEMHVLAGKTYYFEHDVKTGAFKARVKLVLLDEAQGQEALKQCNYFEVTEEGRLRGQELVAMAPERPASTVPVVHAEVPLNTEGMVLVRAGLEVEVELMENLSSRHTQQGDRILFRTTHDLEITEELTVPAGRLVTGVVQRVDRAGGGGDAGEVDVVLPALVTRGGVKIPVIGRVIIEGVDKHEGASNMGAAFGMLGWGLTRGKEAYRLAGARYQLTVREDTWVPRNPGAEERESQRLTALAGALVIEGSGGELTFKPASRKDVKNVVVRFETDQQLTDAELMGVGDLMLVEPIPASNLRSRKGGRWEISLPGWSVLRYARPEGEADEFELPLRVHGHLEDGSDVIVDSVLNVIIEDS